MSRCPQHRADCRDPNCKDHATPPDLGFDDALNSPAERHRDRMHRSIPHSYGGEGRNYVD